MKTFTPISELDPSMHNICLPDYAQPERIGVHLGRVSALAWLGGFQSDGVTITSYSGETTKDDVTVVGATFGGTLLAGSVTETQAPLGESKFDAGAPQGLAHTRPPLSLTINTSEIEYRIGRAGASLREPKVWANMINQSIGSQLRAAAWDHNVRHAQWAETGVYGLCIGAVAAQGRGVGYYLGVPLAAATIRAVTERLADGTDVKDSCWSVLPGVHPDRALMVSGLSCVLPTVKSLKK